ncbi:LacI family DNA-binding transcriptional regulator [Demequina activiva]|uniref:DNA-binding transcriptional regulator CytR n=1 Tax=Demequina activiva TaxID=1582364 RepID=A0A919Q4S6_9MICO|nr:LacI family DNA-binding transcriptional regulator [Demequina activiva]GIG55559.1 DNA-binding transcriptional regulator CytR [Demequina activiva]
MAKIEKVAELAGVSTATVSRALAGKPTVSPATRARVERAAKELGYVVSASASSLASGRTRSVGVVLPFLSSWFYMTVLRGVQRALSDAGYDLTLYHLDTNVGADLPAEHNPRRRRLFEEFLRRKRVDALIAVSLELDANELESMRSLGKPVVGIGGPLPGVPTLSVDDRAIARLATEHLLALGHRQIAHIAGDSDFELDFHLPTTRRAGYEDALKAAGLAPDPSLVRSADFTIAGGYDATLQLLGDPWIHPTAIFAASDEMAIGAMLAARDLGREVPADVSVVGIDGHDLAGFFGLTTVDQFPEVQGRRAVETLLHQLQGDDSPPANEALPYELVVRTSTSSPRDAAAR